MNQNKLAYIIVLIIVGASLTVLTQIGIMGSLQAQGVNVRHLIVEPFSNTLSSINGITDLVGSLQGTNLANQSLRGQVSDLKLQLVELEKVEEENEFLRSQLRLGVPISGDLQVAQVIEYKFAPTPGIVLLLADDPGAIRKGDWVVDSGFIAGVVVEVFGDYLKAQLISSNGFLSQAKVGTKGAVAELEGEGSIVRLERLSSPNSIKKGDEVKLLNPNNPILNKFLFGHMEVSGIEGDLEYSLDTPLDLEQLEFLMIVPNEN
jgi:cell shape-determining protein MreC